MTELYFFIAGMFAAYVAIKVIQYRRSRKMFPAVDASALSLWGDMLGVEQAEDESQRDYRTRLMRVYNPDYEPLKWHVRLWNFLKV